MIDACVPTPVHMEPCWEGAAAVQLREKYFFFLLLASGYLTQWPQKPNYSVLSSVVNFDTAGSDSESRGPRLNFQAGWHRSAPAPHRELGLGSLVRAGGTGALSGTG